MKKISLLAIGLAIVVSAFSGARTAHASDCTVSITAGGLGGGGMNGSYTLSLGWGIGISNTNGKAPCSVSFSPSESGLSSYHGPSYSVPAGGSFGEGPFKNITGASVPYSVSASASVSCPAGNAAIASGGSTASCNLDIQSCSTDGNGNRNCNIAGCSDTKTFDCPSIDFCPNIAGVQSSVPSGYYVNSSGNCIQNTSPAANISGDTSLVVGQTGSWNFDVSDSDGNLKEWRFRASTNTKAGWTGISGSSQSGSHSQSFSAPGTYTWIIEVTDALGLSSSDSVSVVVTAAPVDVCPNIAGVQTSVPSGMSTDSSGNCVAPPVSLSFSGSPTNVSWWTGGTVTLTWSASGASSCTASGAWSGTKSTSGSDSIFIWPFSSPQTYNLFCSGIGGSDSGSVTVNVGNSDVCPNIAGNQDTVPSGMIVNSSGNCVTPEPPATVSLSFSGSPTNVSWWTGGSVALTWSATGADSCTASGDWSGSKSASGTSNVSIWPFSSAKTYSLDCFGSGGQDSKSVTVTIGNSDLCPNIAGNQDTVPSGMTIDGSGNCVTTSTLCADGSNPPCGGSPVGTGGNPPGNGPGGNPTNNNPSSPGFTISGDQSVPIQILSSIGGDAKPASINVNPVNGFTSPVDLSVESIKTAGGVDLTGAKATFTWGSGKLPSETLTYNSSLDNYIGLSGLIGTKLNISIKGNITVPYFITILGTSGSDQATYVLKLDPTPLNPSFIEI